MIALTITYGAARFSRVRHGTGGIWCGPVRLIVRHKQQVVLQSEVSPGPPVGLCLWVTRGPTVGPPNEVRPLFSLKTKQMLQGSLVNSLLGRVDKAGTII